MTRTLAAAATDCFVDAEVNAALAGAKDTALEKMAVLVDWEGFRPVLESLWTWTVADGARGRPSWDAVKLFKVLVFGKYYGDLSAEKLEDECLMKLRVNRVVGLGLRVAPEAKTIHKYRSVLAASARMDAVFAEFSSP